MSGYQGTSTRGDVAEGLRALAETDRREMQTTLPGKVVSYDAARQKASVKPLLKQTIGGKSIEAPDLIEVPVSHPRGGGFIMHKPLKAGDEVVLNFASRSMDDPIEDGASADAHPGRMNDLSDAIATPASFSKGKELPNLPTDGMHVGSEDGKKGMGVGDDGKVSLKGGPSGSDKIVVTPDGKIDMKGESGDSLLQIIRDFLICFKDHTNGASSVDAPYQATATTLIAKIDGMKA